MCFGNLCYGSDIGYLKCRIGGRFNPYQLCFFCKRVEYIFCISGISIIYCNAEFLVDMGEQPEGTTINIIDSYDLVAGLQKLYYGIDSGKSAAECGTGAAVF